jgi:hypothetical protein
LKSWFSARLGRMRVSTVVLIVAFVALFWVYHNFEPRPAATETPPTAVVPPGFVPDPNYTWVPRTNVRRPKEDVTTTTTTTTSPTEPTTTTSPGETTSPTSSPSTPPTTVIDPDGSGPLPAVTIPLPPALLTPTTTAPASGTVPATPAPPG